MNEIKELFSCKKLHDKDDRMLVNNNYDILNIEKYHKINPIYNKNHD